MMATCMQPEPQVPPPMSHMRNCKAARGSTTKQPPSSSRTLRTSALMTALLALLACIAVPAKAQSSKETVVKTAQQLKDAMDGGDEHILITEHLDLSSLPPSTASQGKGAGSVLFEPGKLLRTVRGDCQGAAPKSTHQPAMLDVKPGQCVLEIPYMFANLADTTVTGLGGLGHDIWMSNLYLRLNRDVPKAASDDYEYIYERISLLQFDAFIDDGILWMTNVTLQGDGLSSDVDTESFTGGMDMVGTAIYGLDCIFADMNDAALHQNGGVISCERCTFSNIDVSLGDGAIELFESDVLLNGVQFSSVSGVGVSGSASGDGPYTIYTSTPKESLSSDLDSKYYQVKPLTNVPDTLPRADNSSFAALQREVGQEPVVPSKAPLPPAPDSSASAPFGAVSSLTSSGSGGTPSPGGGSSVPSIPSSSPSSTSRDISVGDSSGSNGSSDSGGDSGGGTSAGAIAGGVVGGVAFLAILAVAVLAIVYVMRRDKAQRKGGGASSAHDRSLSQDPSMARHRSVNLPQRSLAATSDSNMASDVDALGSWTRATFTVPAFAVDAAQLQRTHPAATKQAAKLSFAASQAAPLQRVGPSGPGTKAGTISLSTLTLQQPVTASKAPGRDQLSMALTNMAQAEPVQLFAGRWQLQNKQRHGGQAVVQFARDEHGLQAIKVFLEPADFWTEIAQFKDPMLQCVLPARLHASDNANGAVRSARGYVFPPFIVLERGTPLAEWAKVQRHTMEVWGMVEALAALLAKMHGNGIVHRDLKPDNVLFLNQSMQWRLLDMGIVAPSGTQCLPSCTLPYAPPEIVLAVFERQEVTVQPSHDVWALGVMGFEALTQSRALMMQNTVLQCAIGNEAYPWEAPAAAQHPRWLNSRLRDILEPCLSRIAVQRPSAGAVLDAVCRLGENTSVAKTAITSCPAFSRDGARTWH